MAQYITGAELLAIQDIYTKRFMRKAQKDFCYLSPGLFSPLPSGKQ
jgi:hypothetical protein